MVLQWLTFPICYLLGSVSPAYLVVNHTRHIDLRCVGTGQLGTTNAFMAGGVWCGLVTLAADLGKGALAAWLALRVFGTGPAAMLGLVAVVLGHNFSVLYGFWGGKGFAAGCGALLLLAPQVLLPVMAISLVSTCVTESFRAPDVRDVLTGLVMNAAIPATMSRLLPDPAYLLPSVLLTLVMLASFKRELALTWHLGKTRTVGWHLSRVLGAGAIFGTCLALLAWRYGLSGTTAIAAAAGQWVTFGMILLAVLSCAGRNWRLLVSFAGAAVLIYGLSAVTALAGGRASVELLIPMCGGGWPGEIMVVPAWKVLVIHHLLFGLGLAVGGLFGRLYVTGETKQAVIAVDGQ